VTIDRFSDGKVVEEWSIWDERHLYRQLGVEPKG
jgi:predicted ester cyclase